MRLNASTPAKPAVFEALRGVVLHDWTDATAAEQRTAAVRALARKYKVKHESRRTATNEQPPCAHGSWLTLASRRRCCRRRRARTRCRMAEMEVRETAPGEFLWQWSAQNDKRPMGNDLIAALAGEPARRAERASLRRSGGLKGTLAIDGVGKRYSAALVKVIWLDGQTRVYTLTSAQPTVQLYGSADDRRGRARSRAPTRSWASSTS